MKTDKINPGQIYESMCEKIDFDEDERGHDVARTYFGRNARNIVLGAALTLVSIAGVTNLTRLIINKVRSLENKVSTQVSVAEEPNHSNSPTYDMGFYSCSDFEIEKHTVEKGETFDGIMLKYKMLRKEMGILNPEVSNKDYIRTGQELNVFKRKIEIHKVEFGETLGGIAGKYGVSPKNILENNWDVQDSDKIYEGDSLEIITKYRCLKKDSRGELK